MAILDALVIGAPVEMDPLWRPWAVGNGRVRVTGKVILNRSLDRLQYRFTVDGVPGSWTTLNSAPLTSEAFFGYWAEGLVQGKEYLLEVQARELSSSPDYIVLSEEFTWVYEVRDIVGRFLNLYMPEWMKESEFGTNLYTVMAKAWADIYTAIDDVALQCVPQYTTWAVGLWEEQLGLPVQEGLTITQRRANIVNRRSSYIEGRTGFLDVTQSILGLRYIWDAFAQYIVNLKASGNISESQLRLGRVVIDNIKPVGIRVDVFTGGGLQTYDTLAALITTYSIMASTYTTYNDSKYSI